mgnify:CR=1 FL=1
MLERFPNSGKASPAPDCRELVITTYPYRATYIAYQNHGGGRSQHRVSWWDESLKALGALKLLPGESATLATGKQRRFAHKYLHLMVEWRDVLRNTLRT